MTVDNHTPWEVIVLVALAVILLWPKLARDLGKLLRVHSTGMSVFYEHLRCGIRQYVGAYRTAYVLSGKYVEFKVPVSTFGGLTYPELLKTAKDLGKSSRETLDKDIAFGRHI